MQDKVALRAQLRKQLRERINRLDTDRAQSCELNRAMNIHLTAFLKDKTGIWGTYLPLDDEADVRPSLAASTHIQWVSPRVHGNHLHFFKINEAHAFSVNKWGISEPVADLSEEVTVDQMAGVLVPGLGFDRKCRRLGRGKGYFDRALQGKSVLKVGVGFGFQILSEDLPCEPHDIAMDLVITNDGLIEAHQLKRNN